jgi:hypothetical protein
LAFLQELFPQATLTISAAKFVKYDDIPIGVATGKLVGKKDKGETEIDVVLMRTRGDNGAMLISYTHAGDDPVLRKANLEILGSARVAGDRISVTFERTKTKGPGVSRELTARLEKVGPALGAVFRFPRALPIQIKDCGQVNAFYKPGDHTITICHEMWTFTDDLFTTKGGMKPARAAEATDDAIMWFFFHEFGHALAGELQLPITGKGEDDADELATLITVDMKEGRRYEAAATTFFQVLAKVDTHPDFADEHSLHAQRMAMIVCNMYGAHPEENKPLLKLVSIDEARAGKCVRDYADRKRAWDKLLAPHFRPAKHAK